MRIQRLFIALVTFSLCLATNAIAVNNPFEKNIVVDIGRDSGWVIEDMTATRSGADSDNNYYHLNYDRKQLRLRVTEGPQDTEAAARQYKTLAIEDISVDGKRVPAFQWCLNNQQNHSRYLQQGLRVKNDVCINEGQAGTFYMLLNVATLELLKQGKNLTFTIRPFRTALDISFDISDFTEMHARLVPKVEEKAVKTAKATPQAAEASKKCQAAPPAGFAGIKAIEYDCTDAAARSKAESTIAAFVKTEKERQQKAAAERERKRREAEAKRKKELEAQKAALAAEQAAIAASQAKQKAISNEIADKMISMCKKKWAKGEHRCYCEKYIEHAPPGIESDPSCGG